MPIEKLSPCKVNLLLNVLGRRADSFHELETVMQPVQIFDRIELARTGAGIQLSCSDPALPVDSRNLVYRAAARFLEQTKAKDGVRLHLEKFIPLAAGLGGGSGNAATTLIGLNELFGSPLETAELTSIAAELGSDVPFFLQSNPALATGRGEKVEALEPFPAFAGKALVLVHPGFGVSTPWAYQNLARFPNALNGEPGRATRLIGLLRQGDLKAAAPDFYNSLEAPVLDKYPLLRLFQECLLENGACVTLMSGSGSTTFGIADDLAAAQRLGELIRSRFGESTWTAAVAL